MKRIVLSALLLLGLMLGSAAQAGKVTYVHTDIQGTPVMESDAQGNITARFDYTPYGVPVQGLSGSPNGPGYTGHVNDPDTGFVYMQARYYDPMAGRFLSLDPISKASLSNGYGYAFDNPIKLTDPSGLYPQGMTADQITCEVYHCEVYRSSDDSDSGDGKNRKSNNTERNEKAWSSRLTGVYKGISNGLCELPIIGCNDENDPLVPDNVQEYQGMVAGGLIYKAGELIATDGESLELRAADIGIAGRIQELRGSFSMKGDVATIRIDMIRGSIKNPFNIVENMANFARSKGAGTLKIEGSIANETLYKVLSRRYGMSTNGAVDTITVPIKP